MRGAQVFHEGKGALEEMRNFSYTGLIKLAGLDDLIIKIASPFNRRLAELIRSGKITAVNRKMMDMAVRNSKTPPEFVPLGLGNWRWDALKEHAKRENIPVKDLIGRFNKEYAESVAKSDTVKPLLDKMFGSGDWVKADHNVLEMLEGGFNRAEKQRNINSAFRRSGIPQKRKALQDHIKRVIETQTDGKPVSLNELQQRGSAFKGGEKPMVTGKWSISEPGFVTPHSDLAADYARRPDLVSDGVNTYAGHTVSVTDLSKSKSFRTGKSFATGHEQLTNRRARINANKRSSDPHPSYEIVLPGHEMRGMPWESYANFDFGTGTPTSKLKFYKLTKPEAYEGIPYSLKSDLREARRDFADNIEYDRGKPSLEVLKQQLEYVNPFVTTSAPAPVPRKVTTIPTKPATPVRNPVAAPARNPVSTSVPPKPVPTPSKPAVPKEVPKAVAPNSPVDTQPTSWWKQEQERLMKQRAEQAAMYAESADRHDNIAAEMRKMLNALSSNGVKRLLHRRDIAALKHKIMQQREFSRQAFLKSQRLKWAE